MDAFGCPVAITICAQSANLFKVPAPQSSISGVTPIPSPNLRMALYLSVYSSKLVRSQDLTPCTGAAINFPPKDAVIDISSCIRSRAAFLSSASSLHQLEKAIIFSKTRLPDSSFSLNRELLPPFRSEEHT